MANQIQQIYHLQSCSPPKLIIDRDDEENIGQLCLYACEPTVLQLLRQAHAVAHLPTFIRRHVTTLNTLASNVDQLDLPKNLQQRLRDLLVMRRVLLEAGWFGGAAADDNQLLDEICNSHVSISSFRTLPYKQLRDRYLDRCNPGEHNILRTVWIGDDGLRALIDKYDLSLELLDWFNQQNITDIGMLNGAHVDQLVAIDLEHARSGAEELIDRQTKHDQFRANVRNLFVNEVLNRSTEHRERMKHSFENLNHAITELTSIDRTAINGKTALRQRLTNIGARLQLSWHFSREELHNVDDLLDTLTRDLRIAHESLSGTVSDRWPTDEELLISVNGNAALRGVQLIEPEKKMGRMLLASPVFVSTEESSMDSIVKELTFSNLADSEKFLHTIQTCGLSMALTLLDDRLLPQAEQLVKMRCHVIPVRSFRMTKEQMKLSHDATTALNLVTDITTARTFLSDFGSHISEGTQHVGGIFIHQLAAQTTDAIFDERWNASYAPGYRTHRCHLPSHEPSVNMNHSILSVGPACENFELFESILKTHHSSWHLIDRGLASSFISVWEIIDLLYPSDATMQESAQSLKRAWLTDACDCSPSVPLLCEIDRVRFLKSTTARYLQTPSVQTSKMTESVPQLMDRLSTKINAVKNNVAMMTDEEFFEAVRASKSIDPVGGTEKIRLKGKSHSDWFR